MLNIPARCEQFLPALRSQIPWKFKNGTFFTNKLYLNKWFFKLDSTITGAFQERLQLGSLKITNASSLLMDLVHSYEISRNWEPWLVHSVHDHLTNCRSLFVHSMHCFCRRFFPPLKRFPGRFQFLFVFLYRCYILMSGSSSSYQTLDVSLSFSRLFVFRRICQNYPTRLKFVHFDLTSRLILSRWLWTDILPKRGRHFQATRKPHSFWIGAPTAAPAHRHVAQLGAMRMCARALIDPPDHCARCATAALRNCPATEIACVVMEVAH